MEILQSTGKDMTDSWQIEKNVPNNKMMVMVSRSANILERISPQRLWMDKKKLQKSKRIKVWLDQWPYV